MEEYAAESYVERSRRDRHADMSVVVGLSWRVKGHQAHADYTGGLDTARIWQSLASLRDLSLSETLSRLWHTQGENVVVIPGARQAEPKSVGGRQATTGWRHALARAAPADLQRPSGCRCDGETPEARRDRMRAEHEQKARELLEQRHRRGPGRGADPVPLPVVGDPFFGSGHVFYVIRFPHDDGRGGTRDGGEETDRDGDGDGVQWIAKIPAAAEDGAWDQLCCEALRAEAFLLHMLREETGVPVAEVVDADCRPGNGVGAPWLLMEFVEGWRLEDVWFGGDGGGGDVNVDVDGRARRERREKILRNVAGVVLELGRHEFESGGALVFDRRPMAVRWSADEDCPSTPLYRPTGPWDRPRDMYTALLDAWPPATVSERGVDELLRLLLGLVREPGTARSPLEGSLRGISDIRGMGMGEGGVKMKMKKKKGKFVLTHPDLSMRHILLAEDGTTIKAVLGWDGARAAPRSFGGGRARERETGRAEKRQEGKRMFGGEDVDEAGQEKCEGADVDVTKQSLLTLTLDAAIRDPRCRTAALRRLLEKCSRPFEELDFDFFVDSLGEGYGIDPLKLKCLANNVKELVVEGFVKGAVVW
ncbi:hypothetical protein F4823DRAFT_640228 [Ustulina deusta]|nr:hypothetical protein F4823DRAFT_640228 [Ustulina deusta]